MHSSKKLPIDSDLPAIAQALREQKAVVIQAAPGAGKTTRVPPMLLEMPEIQGQIVVLEPRRLAARMSARRVCEERNEPLGKTIGYEVRFERVAQASTRLVYVTEGIFLRQCFSNPQLNGVSAVVFDEFHERHLHGDVAFALVQKLRATTRPDLLAIVMSATLDAEPIARALGDVPLITNHGQMFDVRIEPLAKPDDRPLELQVVSAIRTLVHEKLEGHILVFLPGISEIRRAQDACQHLAQQAHLKIVTLHGDLSPKAQDAALASSHEKKIILSTNVAETSVTIDGVVAVVDSGLARIARYNSWSGRTRLEVAKIAKSSAKQRAGRAGRTQAGRVIRLFTQGDFDARPEQTLPEIARTDLSEILLQLHASAINPKDLCWLEAPTLQALEGAYAFLELIGAFDRANFALTAIGQRMAKFPLPTRLARLVVEAEQRSIGPFGCTAAAILAEDRDLFTVSESQNYSNEDHSSDLQLRIDAFNDVIGSNHEEHEIRERARRYGLEPNVVLSVLRAQQQLLRLVDSNRSSNVHNADEQLAIALIAAYPDRVAERKIEHEQRLNLSRNLLLCNGAMAQLADSSVVRTARYLVAIEANETQASMGRTPNRTTTRVWLASAIDPTWLIDVGSSSLLNETTTVHWNDERELVEAFETLSYGSLLLDQRASGSSAQEAISTLLTERALAEGFRHFVDSHAFDQWVARIETLFRFTPDVADALDLRRIDSSILNEILRKYCDQKRSFSELRNEPLLDELYISTAPSSLAQVERLAPEFFQLASGRKVKISYFVDQPPSIASRLQDFFGQTQTPSIANQRIELVIHLLAPNGRDVQITRDLAGFWQRTYPQIRNELARRYPRHAWPADPLNAQPPPLKLRSS